MKSKLVVRMLCKLTNTVDLFWASDPISSRTRACGSQSAPSRHRDKVGSPPVRTLSLTGQSPTVVFEIMCSAYQHFGIGGPNSQCPSSAVHGSATASHVMIALILKWGRPPRKALVVVLLPP